MGDPPRVLLVDDSALFRHGLERLLGELDVPVAGSLDSAVELVAEVDRRGPDVVVLDLRLPPGFGLEGLDAARALRAARPHIGVVLLSTYLEAEVAMDLLRLGGGVAYLLKDRVRDARILLEALVDVAAGGIVVDDVVSQQLIARPFARSALAWLTPRELEVLERLAAGRSNAGIAADMGVQLRTVETYVGRIFAKLGLPEQADSNRRVQAVLAWLRAPQAVPS